MKLDLKDSTFIIPVKLESEDRIKNAKIVLNFLQDAFETNIIIFESETKRIPEIIEITENIKYIQESFMDEAFHRTRYLNEMLKLVQTAVTINYDLDIVLPIESYVQSQAAILQGVDLIYPYGFGDFQKQVATRVKDELLAFKEDLYQIMDENSGVTKAEYGHVQFFKTTSYIAGGLENEEFISYGPEDHERYCRFCRLGYSVGRIEGLPVYHLEHERGLDSSAKNPYFDSNNELYAKITEMSVFDLKQYYNKKVSEHV